MRVFAFGGFLTEKRFLLRNDRMIIRLTGCSRASAFRALAELRSFGLVAPTARDLAIVPNAREALRIAEPRLRSSLVRESLLVAVYG